MISPSGVKMRKEVTQNETTDHRGNKMTVYNIRWKPINTEEIKRVAPVRTEITPIKLKNDKNDLKENLGHYKIYQSKEEEKNPYENHGENKEENLDLSCPIEDPRNPFHEEYLKLKALYDGKLINGKEYKKNNSPPQPKLVVKKINSNEKNPKIDESEKKENFAKISEFKNSSSSDWIKVKDPQIINQYFTNMNPSEPRKTSQTVKKEYPNPSLKSLNRPPTIVIETPLSNNSETPTKTHDYQQKPTKLLNQYHYCKDCDVAFQPVKDVGNPIQENFEDYEKNENLLKNEKMHFYKDYENFGKNENYSPYELTPNIYSPDENFYKRESENVNIGGFCVSGRRPQLVKAKNKPCFNSGC